jgi:predicted metal-dependent hydrolase
MPRIYYQNQAIVYTVKRTRRRRSVALRVDPSGAVTVLAPRSAWRFSIDRWVSDRAGWIARKLKEFEDLARRYPAKRFVDGEHFPVWGGQAALRRVIDPAAERPACELQNGELVVQSTGDPAAVRQALLGWYARQTADQIDAILSGHAARLGVRPRSVKVVAQKYRWGSCSARGDLRFNRQLSAYPRLILDYVVVHELAHLKALNHSPRFWAVVASITPDYKAIRTWLRKNAPPYASHFPLAEKGRIGHT